VSSCHALRRAIITVKLTADLEDRRRQWSACGQLATGGHQEFLHELHHLDHCPHPTSGCCHANVMMRQHPWCSAAHAAGRLLGSLPSPLPLEPPHPLLLPLRRHKPGRQHRAPSAVPTVLLMCAALTTACHLLQTAIMADTVMLMALHVSCKPGDQIATQECNPQFCTAGPAMIHGAAPANAASPSRA
jgi:hypothetical protein